MAWLKFGVFFELRDGYEGGWPVVELGTLHFALFCEVAFCEVGAWGGGGNRSGSMSDVEPTPRDRGDVLAVSFSP